MVWNPPSLLIIPLVGHCKLAFSIINIASHHSCWSKVTMGVNPCFLPWLAMKHSVEYKHVGSLADRFMSGRSLISDFPGWLRAIIACCIEPFQPGRLSFKNQDASHNWSNCWSISSTRTQFSCWYEILESTLLSKVCSTMGISPAALMLLSST